MLCRVTHPGPVNVARSSSVVDGHPQTLSALEIALHDLAGDGEEHGAGTGEAQHDDLA